MIKYKKYKNAKDKYLMSLNRIFKDSWCLKSITYQFWYSVDIQEDINDFFIGELSIVCKICDKAFISQCKLDKHMKLKSHANKFSCDVCEKSFTKESKLTLHMRIHNGEKPHECAICQVSNNYFLAKVFFSLVG